MLEVTRAVEVTICPSRLCSVYLRKGFKDSDKALFATETAELRHPMALVQEQSLSLYMSRCPDETPCSIVVARTRDGFQFDQPVDVCTDPNGLEHPFIASYDGRLHLWATRGLGTEIVTAQLDSSGRCDLIKSHLMGDKKSLFSSLSVIEQSGQRILIFAQEREGKTTWYQQVLPDGKSHPLSPCAEEPECWTDTRFSDGEFRIVRSHLGTRWVRGVFIGLPSRSTNSLFYHLRDASDVWFRYGDGVPLSISKGLTSLTQTRFGDLYLMYGSVNGQIYRATNHEGSASDSF